MSAEVTMDLDEASVIFANMLKRSRSGDQININAKKAAAKVIAKKAEASDKFNDKTGYLRTSLSNATWAVQSRKVRRFRQIYTVAGFMGLAPHAHLIEFGHDSPRTGPVAGRYFMKSAAEENLPEIFKAYESTFIKGAMKKAHEV